MVRIWMCCVWTVAANVAAPQERLAPGTQCRDSCRQRAHAAQSTAQQHSSAVHTLLQLHTSQVLLYADPADDLRPASLLPCSPCFCCPLWTHTHRGFPGGPPPPGMFGPPGMGPPPPGYRPPGMPGALLVSVWFGFVSSWEGPLLLLLLHALHRVGHKHR